MADLADLDVLIGAPALFDVATNAPGPQGALPLTEDMLLNAPSGDEEAESGKNDEARSNQALPARPEAAMPIGPTVQSPNVAPASPRSQPSTAGRS